MSEFETLQQQFRAELGRFLVAVQTVRTVDAAAFHRIDEQAEELARLLKGHPLVPKALLHELRVATKVMRAEAPYVEGGNNSLVTMADRLEMTFDLILIGECHGDRVPGVPRIV
jgi:hypothetical protein